MTYLLSTFALLLAIFSIYIATLNWINAYRVHVTKSSTSSFIPFIAGVLGTIAIFLCPGNDLNRYWIVPLVLDWGCIPGHLHAFYLWLKGRQGL